MKIGCISDTHQKHDSIVVPECEVLIVSGDICSSGSLYEVASFSKWLSAQKDKFERVIIIAGNHDRCFQSMKLAALDELRRGLEDKLVYLEDEEYTHNGIKFYGSPWQPEFCNWAFNAKRGTKLQQIWENIPKDTNVLITHGPPHGIGDLVGGTHVGCIDLLMKIRTLENLFLHVFGHIHDSNGLYISEAIPKVNFCNASICDDKYRPINMAHEFLLKNLGTHHHITYREVGINKLNG